MIYDAVIIGAGPAGSTFARQAAVSGKRLLLIDAQTDTNKKPCGGLLAPDAQKALAYFDITLPKNILADPQIFSVKTIDLCEKTVRYYQRCYLNIDRFIFDKWLVSLVPESVELACGKCIGIEKQGDLFVVTVAIGDIYKSFSARQLVGADGANSIVRRTFFPGGIMHYVAIQQWFKRTGKSNPFYSCVFDKKTSESCSWMMYKGSYVIFGGCFLPKHCRASFEEQKARLGDFLGYNLGEPLKTEACMTYRPKKASDFQTGKDGVYLLGEAAGFISASSFEGISSAIISGTLLAQAFSRQDDPGEIAASYHKATRKLRIKLTSKIFKRWFMYTPFARKLIMKSGLDCITVNETK